MRWGARTPEELDALLEDAFVVRDRRAVAALFESGALLVDGEAQQARGPREIASWATETWTHGRTTLRPRFWILEGDVTITVGDTTME